MLSSFFRTSQFRAFKSLGKSLSLRKENFGCNQCDQFGRLYCRDNLTSKSSPKCWQLLGQLLWITLGYFSFQHLVTLVATRKMKREDELLLSFVDEPLLLPLLLPPMLPVMTDVSAARQFRSRLNGTYNFLHEPSSASISFIFSIFQMYTNTIFIIN